MNFNNLDASEIDVKSLSAMLTKPRAVDEITDPGLLSILNDDNMEDAAALYNEVVREERKRFIQAQVSADLEKKILAGRGWNIKTLAEHPPLEPEENDSTVLFKNNFLAQGQTLALVGSSGIGKSSMMMQCQLHWAVGEPFLATPTRPLKVAYIQTEDGQRDLSEQIAGMRRGLIEHEHWTAAQVESAEKNVFISSDFVGKQHDDFIKILSEFQHDLKFDLLVMNPLQGVFGGDLSDQEATSHFCRAGIDPIIKHPDCPCAAVVVMHTPKLRMTNNAANITIDNFAEYSMAGSQEWTAYCRAIFTFLKHGGNPKYVDMACPKRGNRLDWERKIFAFSEGYIYWREVTDEAEIDAVDADVAENSHSKRARGRPKSPEMDIEEAVRVNLRDYKNDLFTTDPDGRENGSISRKDWIEKKYREGGGEYTREAWGEVWNGMVLAVTEDSDGDVYGLKIELKKSPRSRRETAVFVRMNPDED